MFTGRITSTIISPCDMEVAKQNNILCRHPGQDTDILTATTCCPAPISPARQTRSALAGSSSQSQDIRIQPLHQGGTSNLTVSRVSLLLCKFQRIQTSILREEWGKRDPGAQWPRVLGRPKWGLEGGKVKTATIDLALTIVTPGVLITSHPWYQSIFECKPWYMGKVMDRLRCQIRHQMTNVQPLRSSIINI